MVHDDFARPGAPRCTTRRSFTGVSRIASMRVAHQVDEPPAPAATGRSAHHGRRAGCTVQHDDRHAAAPSLGRRSGRPTVSTMSAVAHRRHLRLASCARSRRRLRMIWPARWACWPAASPAPGSNSRIVGPVRRACHVGSRHCSWRSRPAAGSAHGRMSRRRARPSSTRRAVCCSFSWCWRVSSASRLRSVMSRIEPIQPCCLPSASISGAS